MSILTKFAKHITFFLYFSASRGTVGKTRKNRELGVLTSGIKRDGHQKNPGNWEIRELGGTTV